MRKWKLSATAICLAIAANFCTAGERATVTGAVVDANGKPLEQATVVVYQARVRKGYSIFCPTCWVDCGKRAATDADGKYIISGLDPDLVFDLLVIRDGYGATFIRSVDSMKGPAESTILKARRPVVNPAQFVRGQVVDVHGAPVQDALVEQQGVTFRGEDGQMHSWFGDHDWIDLMAATNERGEFEIAFDKPADTMILSVSPRGMAAKLFTLQTGAERKTMTVTDGATITGRLMQNGEPVANAEMGLTTHKIADGKTFPEMRVGTGEDGRFAITNVPARRIYYLYAKMGSLAARGAAAEVVECETKDDDQVVNVGNIQVKPGFVLRGKVMLGDGKPIPPDMHANLFADRTQDSQSAMIGENGAFEMKGLAKGVYSIAASVKGYGLPQEQSDEILVERDVTKLVIRLQPGANQ
jgi:hypothetical protein